MVRFAGCDLGKSRASFVVGTVRGGHLELEQADTVAHEGKPLDAFTRWYRTRQIGDCAGLGSTGVYSDELAGVARLLPEEACLQAAIESLDGAPDQLDVVRIGARGYSVLSRLRGAGGGANGAGGSNGSNGALVYRFLENDKCSSGTGEAVAKLAARFGLTVAQADELARSTDEAIPITARCSVFAKSEMTHYANQGKPIAALLRGLLESVARNAAALVRRSGGRGPIYLVGGLASLDTVRAALGEQLGREVVVPEGQALLEATGAALLAAERGAAGRAVEALPADPEALLRPRERRFTRLAPAQQAAERVTILPAREPPADWAARPVLLGLDLGSTGAKAVLTALDSGEAVLDAYDRTRGNPVDAAQRLVAALLERARPDVRAVGVTGSGREAVATVLRAVLPEGTPLLVLNEIVAHATAAARCDPHGGEDLSIIEIGGQDAKYVRLRAGRIVESDMNKACSAGTGSFLEEQARLYQVADIADLGRMAAAAEHPPDLGQMCTVYVADAAAEALKDGCSLGDIFAGFQHSIIHNYLDRVMGQRTLAATVFFQGKPATSRSLGWTLAAITGRDIVVPPNPGAMGAWGIGLCAIAELGREALDGASPIAIERLLEAAVVARSEFRCRDKGCQTLCPIERTTVQIGGKRAVAVSGGACPKFEVAAGSRPKLPKGAPDPFEERRALLERLAAPAGGSPTVGVPVTGVTYGHLPWLVTLLGALGVGVTPLWPDRGSLAAGEQLSSSFDACGPAKIAHAVCDSELAWLLFPKITEVWAADGVGGESCVTEQAMADIVQQSLRQRGSRTRVIRPLLRFDAGLQGRAMERALRPLCAALGLDGRRLTTALHRAAAAQARYQRDLEAAGARALAYAREHDLPAVLVCGSLHVIHDVVANAQIPRLLRQNGALAIPVDALSIPAGTPAMPKIYWGDWRRSVRGAAYAQTMGDVYPLLITSFGCGPASFVEQIFSAILAGHPHTVLESDGHGGTAGFVTRIQAFLQSVQQHRRGTDCAPADPAALSYVERAPRRGPYLDHSVRYLFLSGTDYLGAVFAAAYRAYGYDAVTAPPLSHESLARGRRDCSGKECMSYQLVWSAHREYLQDHPPDKETRLVQISGQMCRAGLFGVKDKLSLRRMGLDERVSVTALRIAGGPMMTAKVWTGLVVLDVLRQLYLYHLAVEPEPGAAERLYRDACEQVLAIVEQPAAGAQHPGLQAYRQWGATRAILSRAADRFAAMGASANGAELRTVFVSGDLLTKGNDVASGGCLLHLAGRGIRVLMEPTCDFLEFLAREHPRLLFGKGASPVIQALYRLNMVAVRESLYALVRQRHPWLPLPDVPAALARARPIIDPATNGGGAYAVGSVLHHFGDGQLDGVMLTSCWGCDNGLIGESLLRPLRELPAIFFYDDGTPIDRRRLDAFAFRLQRSPARTATATKPAGPELGRRLRSLGRAALLRPRAGRREPPA